ncbi:DUF6083 domain-containing protein [Streptomyces sp. NPDC102406]|uniref:DUF6083 domain-containing protein n=1 Tax=Streptomyces sp. NPDC102406 TaxID=3366171 RepID=UPI00380B38D7
MGSAEGARRRGRGQLYTCIYCGLPQERVWTLDRGTRMLEPDVRPLAHTVPADQRWIELSDGRVAMYGVCPPVAEQRCRILHELVCPGRELPDLWPWLTVLREENRLRADRQAETPPLPSGGEGLPDVG